MCNTFKELFFPISGICTIHTQNFKKLRDKKINRYELETNKLLIRLDKLVCDITDDPERRKGTKYIFYIKS